MAVNTCKSPKPIVGLDGVTAIDTKVGAVALIVSERVGEVTVADRLSVTVITKPENTPKTVGVPEIMQFPVPERTMPDGNMPEVSEHVYEPVPPIATMLVGP